ncbi:MAG: hypothetical protein J6Y31_03670 [Bacteroidales bacterium]|nr:hypothetical protein [Bacteroidales bacterium]
MRRVLRSISALLLCLAAVTLSCEKQQDREVVEHEHTEAELRKMEVEKAFGAFVEQVKLPQQSDIPAWLYARSEFTPALDGSYRYRLDDDLVDMSMAPDGTAEIKLRGGLRIAGTVDRPFPSDWTEWDSHLHLKLYAPVEEAPVEENPAENPQVQNQNTSPQNPAPTPQADEPLCDIGIAPYHRHESGEDYWMPLIVLRYDDGTSYSWDSLLLAGPFVEYLLQNQ